MQGFGWCERRSKGVHWFGGLCWAMWVELVVVFGMVGRPDGVFLEERSCCWRRRSISYITCMSLRNVSFTIYYSLDTFATEVLDYNDTTQTRHYTDEDVVGMICRRPGIDHIISRGSVMTGLG